MTEFSPVWISTEQQLRRLADAYTQATVVQKLLGRYRLPPGTAHLQGLFMPWARVPIVYVAQGPLSMDNVALRFRATSAHLFGWRVREVDSTLTVELTPTDIHSVEPFTFDSPVARLFDLPFTRVRTSKTGIARDFLLCVGGRVLLPRIRARSLELRAKLEAFGRTAVSTSEN